jgi:hypothetical protein
MEEIKDDNPRPMADEAAELARQPPVLDLRPIPPFVIPVGHAEQLIQLAPERHQQNVQDHAAQIEELLAAARDARRDNAALQQMLMQLLPAMGAQMEDLRAGVAQAEDNNAQVRGFQVENRALFAALGERLQVELGDIRGQLAQQQKQIETQGQQIQGAVQQVGQDVQQVQGAVQQVGVDVNLGRAENVANFDRVRMQISEFRDLTITNFNDMKTLIREAGRNAIDGCLPLEIGNLEKFLNTFFRCLYYFGVFMIYIFSQTRVFYMKFRETIINGLVLIFGWIPIPNIDKVLRTLWFLFEIAIVITLINTIGTFFGYAQITKVACQAVFTAIKITIYTGFQLILFIALNNPLTTEIIIPLLESIGFFDLFNWTMATLETLRQQWLTLVGWAETAQQAQEQAGEWAAWAGLKGGAPKDLVLYKGVSVLDNKSYDTTIDNYGNNINNMMAYMHMILTGKQDPKMQEYFDTKETRDLVNELQRRMSSFETFLTTGTTKMLTSPRVTELAGGKTRKRYFKKSSKKRKSKKRNVRSKRIGKKRRINRYKSKKR